MCLQLYFAREKLQIYQISSGMKVDFMNGLRWFYKCCTQTVRIRCICAGSWHTNFHGLMYVYSHELNRAHTDFVETVLTLSPIEYIHNMNLLQLNLKVSGLPVCFR